MENHRHSESEKMAEPDPNLSDSGVSKLSRYEEKPSARRQRQLDRQNQRKLKITEPSVVISISQDQDVGYFAPGSILSAEYMVNLAPETSLSAVEASVIWMTEGKGETDIGAHFFERRNRASFTTDTFDRAQRLSTVLPQSPLSYEGNILKVHWLVRIRLFLDGGRETITDQPFRLSVSDQPYHWADPA